MGALLNRRRRVGPATPTPLDTPCVEWGRGRDWDGYGIVHAVPPGETRKKSMRAHRLAWIEAHDNQPIPEGMVVMHLCDNPPCVNPDHLRLGTVAENNADKAAKGRTSRHGVLPALSGERHPGAKLTAEQVAQIRRLCVEGRMTQRAIAAQFDVCPATVTMIKKGRIWSHVAA